MNAEGILVVSFTIVPPVGAFFMMRSFVIALAAGVSLAWLPAGLAREPQPVVSALTVSSSSSVPDVLEAEKQGLVTVRYIPNDSRSAQILVTNRSKRPVTLRLPTAFAGVPVLAQLMNMGQGGGQAGGFGAGGIGGAQQSTGGGGLGNQGMNGMGGGMGGGGGAFSIPPQKTRVLRVTTVCLEHGKPEPSSRHPYKLSAIESFSTDEKLAIVLESLGRGELPQKVAQAAAWHLSSGLSWERLAAEKIDHAGGVPDEPYFTPAELMAAQRVVAIATQRAAERPTSTGDVSAAITGRQR